MFNEFVLVFVCFCYGAHAGLRASEVVQHKLHLLLMIIRTTTNNNNNNNNQHHNNNNCIDTNDTSDNHVRVVTLGAVTTSDWTWPSAARRE